MIQKINLKTISPLFFLLLPFLFSSCGKNPLGSSVSAIPENFHPGIDGSSSAAPTISSLSPTSGTSLGGTNVTISGTNFAASTTVTVGGASCTTLTFVSSTSLVCQTPAHAVGSVNVVVTNSNGLTATSTGGYAYVSSVTSVKAFAVVSGGAVSASGTTTSIKATIGEVKDGGVLTGTNAIIRSGVRGITYSP